jgi:hypothetical protein
MEYVKQSKVERALHVDPNDEEHIWLTKQDTLRIFVGVLGMFLPVLLYVFLRLDTGYKSPLESISHYYNTRVSSILVITVSLLAIFLIIYKGKSRLDFILSLIAGTSALCVVLFPTSSFSNICPDPKWPYSVTILHESPGRVCFHYINAAIFLLSLAFMSLFQFTQSDIPVKKDRPKGKRTRNFIYSVMGILMVLAVSVIGGSMVFDLIPEPGYTEHHITFWMEVIALECFGISWLVKSGIIIKD